MTARRARSACPHGDGFTSYPVWPDPGWPLGHNAEVDSALSELSDALMACPDPLGAALTQLTAPDISKGLSTLPLARRPAVLHPLGLKIKPRTVGQQLCMDVLRRLGRADGHSARHSAAALTSSVLVDVEMNVFAAEFLARVPPPVVREPLARWSEALVRVAVWANGLASVRNARLWLWASEQPWFRPDGLTDAHVATIVAAARNVTALSKSFRLLNHSDDTANTIDPKDEPVDEPELGARNVLPGSERGSIPATKSDTSSRGADACTPPTTGHAPATSAGDDSAGGTRGSEMSTLPDTADSDVTTCGAPGLTEAAESVGELSADQLWQAGDALHDALRAAVPAAQRVIDTLGDDRPPTREDLDTLLQARTAFDAAVSALEAVGQVAAELTGTAVRAALDNAGDSASDLEVRAQLDTLHRLVAPDGNLRLHDTLTLAQQRARGLAAMKPWGAQDRQQARRLAALTQLADPATPPADVLTLQQELVQTHPDLALLAVTASQLTRVARPSTADRAADQVASAAPQPPHKATIEAFPAGTETSIDPSAEMSAAQTTDTSTHMAAATELAPGVPAQAGSCLPAPTAASTTPPAVTAPSMPDASTTAADAGQVSPAGPPSVSDEVTAHTRAVEGAAALVGAQRYGLAAAVASAAWSESQQAVLRIASLADATRSETGACNAALRTELTKLDTVGVGSTIA